MYPAGTPCSVTAFSMVRSESHLDRFFHTTQIVRWSPASIASEARECSRVMVRRQE